ncbi:MAG: metalloprotease PmbA [Gammaproteobacteria bacterium RIFCSPLOWO2_02_FULL_61_13]|nr:MAG: metalloprotease PmbA [Gammaproteobacteria bacterium RIFCSPLOWO2_02_FULL_61_13]
MSNQPVIKNAAAADLRQSLQAALQAASDFGATAAEADIGTGHGLSVSVRQGEPENVEHQRDKALSLTVYVGQRKGSASSTDLGGEAVREIARSACDIARHASPDPCAGLLEPRYLARTIPDLDLVHPWNIDPEQAIDLALGCEREALAADRRITNSDGALVSTYTGCHWYANSNGFIGGWDWSTHSVDCAVIAEDGAGMQRDGWYTKHRNPLLLEPALAVGRQAGERAAARLGSRRLSTRRAPVIFEAPVASGLFSAFVGAISGAALYRKASFLLDRLGTEVFAPHLRIHEQPHLKCALGSAPFDSDGMATCARDLIQSGVLQGYVLDAYSARKLGLEPTGNGGGVHNLIVEANAQDLAALLLTMGTGLLITDLIGFGVNQVTGDYSRGASGFWVENGAISFPVEEITVAGNLLDMYKNIIATGSDVDWRGNVLTGSVLVDGLTIAGE